MASGPRHLSHGPATLLILLVSLPTVARQRVYQSLLCNQGPDSDLGSIAVMWAWGEEAALGYIAVERAAARCSACGVGEAAVATSKHLGHDWWQLWVLPVQWEHLCAGGACLGDGRLPVQGEHLCGGGASLCDGSISVQGEHLCVMGVSLCRGSVSVQREHL